MYLNRPETILPTLVYGENLSSKFLVPGARKIEDDSSKELMVKASMAPQDLLYFRTGGPAPQRTGQGPTCPECK